MAHRALGYQQRSDCLVHLLQVAVLTVDDFRPLRRITRPYLFRALAALPIPELAGVPEHHASAVPLIRVKMGHGDVEFSVEREFLLHNTEWPLRHLAADGPVEDIVGNCRNVRWQTRPFDDFLDIRHVILFVFPIPPPFLHCILG